MICIVDGCDNKIAARGYCTKHYQRLKRFGDPLALSRNAPGAFTCCSVPGCQNPYLCKGFCSRHYMRWIKHGDPALGALVGAERGEPLRWLIAAANSQTDECLLWPYCGYRNGYGSVWYKGQLTGAHRAACLMAHGEPSDGKEVAHGCGQRRCCNPRHLRWASPSENQQDKRRHGTAPIGSKNGCAKLTEVQIPEIRLLATTEHPDLIAKRFGVTSSTISYVLRGKTWRHVP
jgi:HNH endonuclease